MNVLNQRLSMLVIFIFIFSCGGPAKPPKNPNDQVQKASSQPGGKAKKVNTIDIPEAQAKGENITLEGFWEDDMQEGDPETGGTPEQKAKGPQNVEYAGGNNPTGKVKDVYRRVAPATVIIQSEKGYGTGVIYDPAGWVLTNNHVIAHAERDNFRWKVKVTLGSLSKMGVMEKREKVYEAYVHKADKKLDLAVLKLIDPPKDLMAVAISPKDPMPGENVTAIGHAGIGLVWAIKDGQVSAIGKLSTHLAQLMLDRDEKDQKKKGKKDFRAAFKKKMLARYRKNLAEKMPALVIQSTCNISQGDSGGPLVNRQSEIVGLNAFVRSGRFAKKESNFHIHVKEIREFIKEVPKDAPQLLPNPWTDGGAVAKLGDADLDGKVDTMVSYKVQNIRRLFRVFKRKRAAAYFIDLDQDALQKAGKFEDVSEFLKNKNFDAEFIFLAHNGRLHAWYDVNNDGSFDILLVAKPYAKVIEGGFRILKDGSVKADESLKKGMLIQPALYENPSLAQRLQKTGERFFGSFLLKHKSKKTKYPDPIRSAGHEGRLRDYDKDGKADGITAKGLWSSGFIVDADQNSLGQFKVGDSLEDIQTKGAIDAEFSMIYEKRQRWAWYDTNDDGKFDLLLRGSFLAGHVVQEAWRVNDKGDFEKDPAQFGRLLARPGLLKSDNARFEKIVTKLFGTYNVARDEGEGSFLDPQNYVRYGTKVLDAGKMKKVGLSGRFGRCQALLLDLDQDTMKKAKRRAKKEKSKEKLSLDNVIKKRQFDAEFALVRCRSMTWAFYDSKGKGKYDTVVYSSLGLKSKPKAVYIKNRKGKMVLRKKPIDCEGVVYNRLFKNRRLRKALKKSEALLGVKLDKSCKI